MARVALLCADLLFGSKVEGALAAAGHDVTRFDSEASARSAEADVLVVDLTDPLPERTALGREAGVPTLAFYSHVDVDARRAAEEAGFDLVVPRSRMARETAALVERLAA